MTWQDLSCGLKALIYLDLEQRFRVWIIRTSKEEKLSRKNRRDQRANIWLAERAGLWSCRLPLSFSLSLSLSLSPALPFLAQLDLSLVRVNTTPAANPAAIDSVFVMEDVVEWNRKWPTAAVGILFRLPVRL